MHGVSLETAILPEGWKERCVPVQNANTRHFIGWCLEAHDLALSKLAAFRDKDRSFVRVLLREGLVEPSKLLALLPTFPITEEMRDKLESWIRETAADLGAG